VTVQPHARYRLSGWIKTEGITPLGDAYGALFNVHELQNPRVVTPAVTGTHDWTRVEVEFDSGDHAQLTLNCLLGGWGGRAARRGTTTSPSSWSRAARRAPSWWRRSRRTRRTPTRRARSRW
jgi:hypothetical protein